MDLLSECRVLIFSCVHPMILLMFQLGFIMIALFMNVDFVNLENSQFYFHSEQYICSVFELPTVLSTQDSYFQCNFFFLSFYFVY